MLAISIDAARNLAMVLIVTAVVLAVLAAIVVKVIVSKLVTVAALAAIVVLVWSQRAAVSDCASRVREEWEAAATAETTCAFLGQQVSVPR